MEQDILIGIFIIFAGLAFLFYITLRSRKLIHRIAARRSKNTREILKDLQDGA